MSTAAIISTSGKTCRNLLHLSSAEINEWLDSFDTILTDCDGVLWLHNEAIAGSASVIEALRSRGKRIYLVTNNSARTRAQFASKAVQLQFGAHIDADAVVTTAHVAACYVRDHLAADQLAYVIGSSGVRDELDAAGVRYCGFGADTDGVQQLVGGEFVRDPRVGAVLVAFDENFSFAKVAKAATYLSDPACLFVATSIDARSPIRCAVIPGTGALLRSVEEAAGRKALVVGKPNPLMLDAFLRDRPDIRPERTLMIGDRCNTDVALGSRCGFRTLLVGSGVHGLDDVRTATDADQVPDWYLPGLADLAAYL